MSASGIFSNQEKRDRSRSLSDAKCEKLREALQSIIAHYDEHGARTRGMDMIIVDCRKLLEEK